MPTPDKTQRLLQVRPPTMPAKSLLMLALFLAIPISVDAQMDPLLQLLQHRHCARCNLNDADLVHADLRDVDLKEAQLKRANLSQAKLDGADLSGSDLSFSSFQGASLRGSDLRGSILYGTDLRSADLSGAQLDQDALERAHWQGARGVALGSRSHAGLHNAGVDAAQAGRWPEAEQKLLIRNSCQSIKIPKPVASFVPSRTYSSQKAMRSNKGLREAISMNSFTKRSKSYSPQNTYRKQHFHKLRTKSIEHHWA